MANRSLASVLIYLDDEIRAGGRKRAPFPAYAPTIDKTGNAQLHRRNSDLHNGGQCRHPINRNNFEDGSSVPAKQQQSNDRQKKKRKECGDRPQPSVGKSSECDGGKSYKGKPAGVVDQAGCNIRRLKHIRPIGCEGAQSSMRHFQTGEDRPGDFSRPSHLIPLARAAQIWRLLHIGSSLRWRPSPKPALAISAPRIQPEAGSDGTEGAHLTHLGPPDRPG